MLKAGFTLLELLISLTIITLVLSISLPWGIASFRADLFQTDVNLTKQQIILARTAAMQNQDNIKHGIKIEPHQLSSIPDNQIIPLNLTIEDQPSVEIIFGQLSGRLSSPISFTLTNGTKSISFIINQEGAIDN